MGEYVIFKQDDGKIVKIMPSEYDEESLLQLDKRVSNIASQHFVW